jgi:hypothetical protein
MKNLVKRTKVRRYGSLIAGSFAQHQETLVQSGFQQCVRHWPLYVNLEGHNIDL